ncbi:MAG: nitroreductase family protein [Actinomycetota bacterium]|nr:nitroreductase family protein [Actinomycetota bacterium]
MHVVDPDAASRRSRDLAEELALRRTVRDFAPDPVPEDLVVNAVAAAATAPSGANRQPWRFVVVTDPELKARIREGAETEERTFYEGDHAEWHEALAGLGTDWRKPMLTAAPVLIAVFEVHAGDAEPRPYYAKESVGIAVGMLLTSLHLSGLATLTHTPSPMRFLGRILDRPANERPFCLVVTGYPRPDALVPDIGRKPLTEVLVWRRPGGRSP